MLARWIHESGQDTHFLCVERRSSACALAQQALLQAKPSAKRLARHNSMHAACNIRTFSRTLPNSLAHETMCRASSLPQHRPALNWLARLQRRGFAGTKRNWYQVNFEGPQNQVSISRASPAGGASDAGVAPSVPSRVISFIDKQFLPIALLASLVAGYSQPNAAVAAWNAGIGGWATFVIFVLSGLLECPSSSLAASDRLSSGFQ
jgi:hypothetical protein